MNLIEITFASCMAACFGLLIGWASAHETVAKECERLGGFYVNKTVYKCAKDSKP
jgi:hypothetical protein